MKARWAILWFAMGLLLGACAPSPVDRIPPSDTPPGELTGTPTPSPTSLPLPTPSPTATLAPRQLTVCTGAEPDTLFPYGGSMYVADVIRQAIFDGPIDPRGFDLQPVILEKIPSLSDGDAAIEPRPVQEGDLVVDDSGEVIVLSPGDVVRPAGCRQPGCALAWDGEPLTMDQLSVDFILRGGIRWSDGEPLTAQDSTFSYTIARNCQSPWGKCGGLGLSPPNQGTVERTASYMALDERRVRWIGLPGYLDPNYRTNFFIPLPEHNLAHIPASQILETEQTRLPLGWGPYALKDWRPGERIVVERNPFYFRADEGLPYFDRVIFRFVGQDTDRNLGYLEAGACDVLTLDIQIEDELERLVELGASGKLSLYANPGPVWEHLDFGINPSSGFQRPDLFEDVALRRALALCIDRQRIVDEIFHGLTLVPQAYISPFHPLYVQAEMATYPYDLSSGMALLEEIGWRDADGDGVREAHGVPGVPQGTALRLEYLTTTALVRQQVAGRIASDLAACGIVLDVNPIDPEQLFSDGPDGRIFGRRFDLAQFAWLTGANPPCELFLSYNTPSEANNWRGQNNCGYSNPMFDSACQTAVEALPGTPEYTRNHLEALRIFSQDLPVLPLFLRITLSASRPDLSGLEVDPSLMAETWNIEAWRLAP